MTRLRFLQIPKTAGYTLATLLVRQYPGARWFAFSGECKPDTQRYLNLPEKQRQEIKLFLGHAPIRTGIPDADSAILITILRDPISRVKSFCYHVREGKSPYLLKDFPPQSFDLDRFLSSGTHELYNMQTKMLINTGIAHSPELLKSMSAAAARDLALQNLCEVVSRFGIQEYFNESLILFGQFLNWNMPFYLSKNRRDDTRVLEFKQRHLDQIAELNSIDMEVYRAAKEKFLIQIEADDYDRAKLKWFNVLNPIMSPVLKIQTRVENLKRQF